MDRIYLTSIKFFFITVIGSLLLATKSLAQLEIQVVVSPPYPTHLSDFRAVESNIFVTVRNTSSEAQDFIFTGSLRNEDIGVSVSTDPASPATGCFSIGPGATRNFSGADLEETFNPDNLIYTGTTREKIRGDEALPEGRYKLCLRAASCVDPSNPLSPIPDEFTGGCGTFEVSYVDEPVIMNPDCDAEPVISTDEVSIPIVWNWMPPARGYDEINFNVKVVEVDPPTRDPNDALNTSPVFFEMDVTNTTSYNLLIPDDITLEEGRKYAIQITASDPFGEIEFKNEGKSMPCTFWYGSPEDGTSVSAVYPKAGDAIPFREIPIISGINQLGDALLIDNFIRINRDGSDYESRVSERLDHKDRAVTEWDYERLVLEAFPSVYRANCAGADMSWQVETDLDKDGRTVNLTTGPQYFTFGMTAPSLNGPEEGTELPAGNVNFRWQSEKPERLLPPYDFSDYKGISNLTVDERWVLEVARSSAFDSIVHTASERIEISISNPVDSSNIISALYDELNQDISITGSGTYSWRVKWVEDPTDAGSEAYVVSPTNQFTIVGGGALPEDVPATTSTDGPCVGDCEMETITDTSPVSSLSEGQNISIRNFNLEITALSSPSSPFSGEGVITIPFMNDLKVNVTFENLEVNASGQVFAGRATAVQDSPSITGSDLTTTIAGETVTVPTPGFTDTDAFNAFFEGGDRLVRSLTGSPIGMPVGLDNEVAGVPYTIGIVGMTFSARNASFDALMATDIPGLGNKMIALGANDVCLTPSGLGENGRLYLARDWDLVQAGGTEFTFTGAETATTPEEITYAEWDCNGFKCLKVNGQVSFPRDKLVKENDAGEILPEKVTGTINVESCRGMNIMARIDIDPFQVKGFKGWGFHITDAWWDLSDAENPESLSFPEGYENPSIMREADDGSMEPMPGMINTWKGFYLQLAEIKTPQAFSSGSGRGSANVEDLIIDETGFTANINVDNIIDYSSGNAGGWAFSLDTIDVQFVQNSFQSGGFNGKLGTPLFEGDDHLKYNSTLSLSDTSAGSRDIHYNFTVSVGTESVDVNAWKLRMSFKPGSSVAFDYQQGAEDPVSLEARLNGTFGLQGDKINKIPGISFNGIEFENLVIKTEPDYFNVGDTGIDGSVFGLASPQKYMARTSDGDGSSAGGFPVTIDNIQLTGTPTNPAIGFTTMVHFVGDDDGGFSGNLTFELAANLTIPEVTGDKFSLSYDALTLESIYVAAEFGGMALEGYVDFYDEVIDGKRASGTRGQLSIDLPIGGGVDIYANFGSTETFRYWRVDGLVTFPEGTVPIFSGFDLRGLGGGVYYHMTQDSTSLPTLASVDLSAESTSKVSIGYTPTTDIKLGFSFTAIIAMQGNSETFNMDVTLRIEGSSENAIQEIRVNGNGYFMKEIDAPPEAADVRASIALLFDNEPGDRKIIGNVKIYVDAEFGPVYLRGDGDDYLFTEAAFYFSKSKWYVHMPPPDGNRIQRNTLLAGVDFGIGDAELELSSYLLVGHEVPNQLPPLPDRVRSFFASDNTEAKPGNTVDNKISARNAQTEALRSSEVYTSGQGFATGVHLGFEADLTFAIFYASLTFDMGFDVNFTKHPLPCLETGSPPGMNGWYAKGRVYAALDGSVGINLDLFFVKKKIEILGLGAAFELRGELPNPYYFQGRVAVRYNVLSLIKGTMNMNAEFGKQCTTVAYDSPFGDMKLISDMRPSGNADVFTTANTYFNLPVYKTIEFPGEKKDEVHVYEPYIDEYRFRNAETGESFPLVGEEMRLKDGNLRADLVSMGSYLPGHTDVEAYINVRAYEIIREDGANRRIQAQVPDPDSDGMMDWPGEQRTTQFTTGPEPKKIPDEQVRYTYPIKRQNFFLQDESDSHRGIIHFKAPMGRLFNGRIDIDDDGSFSMEERFYEYVVRFTNLDTKEKTETILNYEEGKSLWFDLPRLDNEAYYSMQIVGKSVKQGIKDIVDAYKENKREDKTVADFMEESGMKDKLVQNDLVEDANLVQDFQRNVEVEVQEGIDESESSTVSYATDINVNFTDYIDSLGLSEPTLPGEQVREHEHMLYRYYFRTSQYNTLDAKLSDMTYDVEENEGGWFSSYGSTFDINVTLSEAFDVFDVYGYSRHGKQQLPPLLLLKSEDNPYIDKIESEIYSMYNSLLAHKNARFPNPDLYGDNMPSSWGSIEWCLHCMPIETMEYHKEGRTRGILIDNESDIWDPIPDWALENAAGINEPAPPPSSSSGDDDTSTGPLTMPSGETIGSVSSPVASSLSSGLLNGSVTSLNISSSVIGHVDISPGESSPQYELKIHYNLYGYVLEDAISIRDDVATLFDPFLESDYIEIYGVRLLNKKDAFLRHCRQAGLESEAHDFMDFYEFYNHQGYKDWHDKDVEHRRNHFRRHRVKTGNKHSAYEFRFEGYSEALFKKDRSLWRQSRDFIRSNLWEKVRMPEGTYDVKLHYSFPGETSPEGDDLTITPEPVPGSATTINFNYE